ncbi:MAG: sugar kinase [Clostridia bacterium]|nr:sugar kinase [Clostridia bacterium]
MNEIMTMGEIIVEIMRGEVDQPLDTAGIFKGPYPSGAPAIFIDTAARLGHKAAIVGGVGDDDFGKCLLDRLEKDGVDTSCVIKNDRISTGCAFVMYYSNGDRKFIFHIGNTPAVLAPAPAPEKLDGLKFFHIMGCSLSANLDFGKRIVETAKAAKAKGAKISFDPNIRPELMKDPESLSLINSVLDMTCVFMPGKSELRMLSGKEDIEEAVKALFEEKPGLEIIALKNGKKGCVIYTRDERIEFGVYAVTPVDATGAGDSFDAAFLCALLEGKDLLSAAKFATAAASLNTAAFGPMEGKISRENVEKMIEENNLE